MTTFEIDGHHHLTAITGPENATRRFTYDRRGLMTHETDKNGNLTEHIYDQYGRIAKTIEPASGGTQQVMTFTPSGTSYPLINDSPVGDPDTPAPAMPVSSDLRAGVEYGRGGVSGRMDRWGRWLEKTDALGRTTTYQRDDAGNLLRRDYPDGSCDEYSYYEEGAGDAGNLIRIEYPDVEDEHGTLVTPTVSYSYTS